MSVRPDVSVLIPSIGRAQLGRAVRGALAQSGVEVEVVIGDDGPPGAVQSALAGLEDERVRVIEVPGGPYARDAAARNAALGAAHGDWVAFLDDDDLWAPGKLRDQLDAAQGTSSWVAGGAIKITDQGEGVMLIPAPEPKGLARELLRQNAIGAGASSVVARRERMLELGGFDQSFKRLSDWDCWLRLAAREEPARFPGIVTAWVDHEESASRGTGEEQLEAMARLAVKHADAARAAGVRFAEVWEPRWRAQLLRREGRRGRAALTLMAAGLRTRSAGNVARGATVLLGERAMNAARRRVDGAPAVPDWVHEALQDGRSPSQR